MPGHDIRKLYNCSHETIDFLAIFSIQRAAAATSSATSSTLR
jgi:hypothetical protein